MNVELRELFLFLALLVGAYFAGRGDEARSARGDLELLTRRIDALEGKKSNDEN